jgi:hypothetical protein
MGEGKDEDQSSDSYSGLEFLNKSSTWYTISPLTLILSHQGRGKKRKNGEGLDGGENKDSTCHGLSLH